MSDWVRVGCRSEFPEGHARCVKVDGERVAVFRRGGRLWALRDACPHMGASLADGHVVGDRVVCSWHGWSFDLATGRSDHRTGACARSYGVREEGDDVLVSRPDPPSARQAGEDEEWVVWDDDEHLPG